MRDLRNFFCPRSVAIIGASRSPEKVGAIVLKNIIDSKFKGNIYPINPNAQSINALPCYPDIHSLPEVPDLAIIAIPANLVLDAIKKAGEKGVKNIVVFSAGFKEIGEVGEQLEKDLVDVSNKYGMYVLGPNCIGFINTTCPINATFGQPVNRQGNIRFISQSGAIASSLFDWCSSTTLGFREFVTLGNKAVLNENDIMRYFLDPQGSSTAREEGLSDVNPLGLYLESISDGPEFLKMVKEISKKDPVFILKPGKTQAAASAMRSHTGSIAGEDAVLDAALSQTGVVRCKTLDDFFDLSRSFAWENAPLGPRVAVISNAGGPAVISADAVIQEGLELAQFDSETKSRLAHVLPRSASVLNPVDVLGDALADRILQASEIILQTNQADALLVILTPQAMTEIEKTAECIGNVSKKYQKPIFCSFIGGSLVSEGERRLNECKIPSFRFPERAIFAIGSMWRWRKYQKEETVSATNEALSTQTNLEYIKPIIEKAMQSGRKVLNNVEGNIILLSSGIPIPATKIVSDMNQAKNFARGYGWPVVLKISSSRLLHKTDIGGVITQISDEEELQNAWDKLRQVIGNLQPEIRDDAKIQIQKDITNGVEVIAGVKRDPTFGLVLLFGAGGTLAELIVDRNLHLLPIEISQARKLVQQSKIFSILKGYRGGSPYALDRLYELIVRLGKVAQSIPEILEIEVNPIIVTLNDTFAVDVKIVLDQKEDERSSPPIFYEAKTLKNTILASKYHFMTFETKNLFLYQPGQFVTIKVAERVVRAYSISGQDAQNQFNILVDTSPGGMGSIYFETLKPGTMISYLGPFGTFAFRKNDNSKHIVFLGTGSGCSPLKCMLESVLKTSNVKIPITLYLGLRYQSDIFWKEYFQKLADEHPNFNFELVLSKPDETWQGLTGHVTELVNKDFPDASGCSVYLCGNKAMIDEATQILLSRGCSKKRIYSEKF
ncbi:hypothetical protein COT62_03245 [Candidatus Roizmanbacteria bacterium CG09_land_8_20_14_0_10_41_9]|uniref:Acyl-CoA synthetase n=1 Tax=Candidatus Roizmanbacteria bacterium CG09_land_8_20_14_0_10_41_9 TaxID=1974850 RepID=A0A2H0WUB4_9BACT|nr:MAG: hypothetical protein COT62_03245 [Candidatus Roizmanbacteria bacterium CG09_land_8_20_14_0_10_41_9]